MTGDAQFETGENPQGENETYPYITCHKEEYYITERENKFLKSQHIPSQAMKQCREHLTQVVVQTCHTLVFASLILHARP